MKSDNLVYKFANFINRTKFEKLNKKVIYDAKRVVLDICSNIIYTRYNSYNSKILDYAISLQSLEASNNVSIIGMRPHSFRVEDAVFVYSIMARYADLDDGYSCAMGHPGSSIVPLALSLSEYLRSSGKDFLVAIVVAYDVYYRIGVALNPYMYRQKGIDATGICGAAACAATASKLLGLTTEQIKNAIGLATLNAGGLIEYQNDGSSGKLFCGATAAVMALRATRLAQYSFLGPDKIFEGKNGLFRAFGKDSSQTNIENLSATLGINYKISDVYFKRYACMRGLHAILDGILIMKDKYSLILHDITSIEIVTSSFVGRLSNPYPQTIVAAQNSLEFCVAILLKYGNIATKDILMLNMTNQEILNFASHKIKLTIAPEIESYIEQHPSHFGAAHITITTKTGQQHSIFTTHPIGDVEAPFDLSELKQKFHLMQQDTPISEHKVLNSILNIEELNIVSTDNIFKNK